MFGLIASVFLCFIFVVVIGGYESGLGIYINWNWGAWEMKGRKMAALNL